MPSVPRRQGAIGTAPLPGVRVSTDVPANAFRVPSEPIDVAPVARAVAVYRERHDRDADQLALLDADNQLAKLHTDLQLEASQRKGRDAMGATADVEAKWQEGVGAIEKTLTNDRQRLAFYNSAGSRYQSLYESVERHAAAESERYDTDTTETALKNRVNDALVNYRDPQAVAKAALELRAIVRDHGRRQGWAPETIEERSAEQLSRLHSGVISRFLHVGDDLAAKAYYEKAKSQIIGEHRENIDQALQEGSTLGEAQRNADAILAGRYGSGLVTPGNINLRQRPRVRNADGSISTVRSISIEEDGKIVLIPTVSPSGKVLSDNDAIALYRRTGQHLGTFKDEPSATAYAQRLHEAQARGLTGGDVAPTRSEAYELVRSIEDAKVRRATEQQLDTEYARQDRLEHDQHDQFLKTAADYADRGRIAPATILTRLTAPERRSLESYRRSVVRGEPIETDWAAYYALKQQAGNAKTRAAFMKTNLLAYRDKLANSEFEELVKLQTNVTRSGDMATRGFMSDLQLINTTLDQAGLFPKAGRAGGQKDDAAKAQFLREVDTSVQEEKQRMGKETLPSDVVQKIADSHVLRRAFRRGELGTDERDNTQFQYLTADKQGRPFVPTESIPEGERNKIAAYLRRLGYTVSTSKIERLYGAALLRVPQQSFDDIAREP